jgi:hypothetical protein
VAESETLKGGRMMKPKKLFAATILILSPLVIAAVSLTIPNLSVILGFILLQDPATRSVGFFFLVVAGIMAGTAVPAIAGLFNPLFFTLMFA